MIQLVGRESSCPGMVWIVWLRGARSDDREHLEMRRRRARFEGVRYWMDACCLKAFNGNRVCVSFKAMLAGYGLMMVEEESCGPEEHGNS